MVVALPPSCHGSILRTEHLCVLADRRLARREQSTLPEIALLLGTPSQFPTGISADARGEAEPNARQFNAITAQEKSLG